jgi:hypothetical protein
MERSCDAMQDWDEDGVPDIVEIAIGTDPGDQDTDDDGLRDDQEYYVYKTNPLSADSDFDGLPDGYEVGVAYPIADSPNGTWLGTDVNAKFIYYIASDGEERYTFSPGNLSQISNPLSAFSILAPRMDGEFDTDHDGIPDITPDAYAGLTVIQGDWDEEDYGVPENPFADPEHPAIDEYGNVLLDWDDNEGLSEGHYIVMLGVLLGQYETLEVQIDPPSAAIAKPSLLYRSDWSGQGIPCLPVLIEATGKCATFTIRILANGTLINSVQTRAREDYDAEQTMLATTFYGIDYRSMALSLGRTPAETSGSGLKGHNGFGGRVLSFAVPSGLSFPELMLVYAKQALCRLSQVATIYGVYDFAANPSYLNFFLMAIDFIPGGGPLLNILGDLARPIFTGSKTLKAGEAITRIYGKGAKTIQVIRDVGKAHGSIFMGKTYEAVVQIWAKLKGFKVYGGAKIALLSGKNKSGHGIDMFGKVTVNGFIKTVLVEASAGTVKRFKQLKKMRWGDETKGVVQFSKKWCVMHLYDILEKGRHLGAQSDAFSHFHPDVIANFTSKSKEEFLDWALKNFDTYFDRVVTVAEDAKIRGWDRLAKADGVTRAVSQSAVRVERIY